MNCSQKLEAVQLIHSGLIMIKKQ